MDDPSRRAAPPCINLPERSAGAELGDDEAVGATIGFLSLAERGIGAPIEDLLGTVELLLETELSEEQRRYVEWVQESGAALLTIVNNLRDFSKIEAGEIHLEDLDFDLHTTVAKAA
jgi:signal transduction histidine kinase